MQDIRNKLTVLHSVDGSTFTDKSFEAFDYLSAEELTCTDDLYIGFSKPINAVYVSLPSDASNSGSFTWQYWDGTEFVGLDVYDSTRDFTQDGFVQWTRNQTGEAKTTLDGTEAYWYKVQHSTSATYKVKGINILFCDAQDLKNEFAYVDHANYIPTGETSHIRSLVVARDAVLTAFNVSPWDLLQIAEVRTAAVYYALYHIFKTASDLPDDKDAIRSQHYFDKFHAEKSKIRVSVDLDNDGKESDTEKKTSASVMAWSR